MGKDKKRFVGGLPVAVIQSLTLGPSGFPFYGSDTGDYLKVRRQPACGARCLSMKASEGATTSLPAGD